MPLRILDERAIDATLDRTIRAALCEAFPTGVHIFSKTRAWNGCAPSYSVIIQDDTGELIAHAGVHDRVVRINDEPLRVSGLQNVMVVAKYRGQRRVDELSIAAMDEAMRRGFDVGILYCLRSLVPVYGRTGWIQDHSRKVTRMLITGETAAIESFDVMMWKPLQTTQLPPGDIDLRGYDW